MIFFELLPLRVDAVRGYVKRIINFFKEKRGYIMLIPAWRKMVRYDGGSWKSLEKKTVAVAGRPQVSVNFFA